MPNVRFIIDNVATLTPTDKMMSVRKAYSVIDSIFPMPYAQIVINNVKLSKYLLPNVTCDSVESKRMLSQAYLKALAPVGVVQKGERIIDKGDIVTPQTYELLKEYERMLKNRENTIKTIDYQFMGQIVLVAILVLYFFTFLYYFRWRTFNDMRRITFLIAFLSAFTLVAYIAISSLSIGVYVMPFTVLPIIITRHSSTHARLHSCTSSKRCFGALVGPIPCRVHILAICRRCHSHNDRAGIVAQVAIGAMCHICPARLCDILYCHRGRE